MSEAHSFVVEGVLLTFDPVSGEVYPRDWKAPIVMGARTVEQAETAAREYILAHPTQFAEHDLVHEEILENIKAYRGRARALESVLECVWTMIHESGEAVWQKPGGAAAKREFERVYEDLDARMNLYINHAETIENSLKEA